MRANGSWILACFVAACGGGSDNKPVDALIVIADAAIDAAPDAFEPVFDFTCMGNAAPTTAPATITISGTVNLVVPNGFQVGIEPGHNVQIQGCRASDLRCQEAELFSDSTIIAGCPATGWLRWASRSRVKTL